MTNKQLAKLWAAIAAILLFYLINSYLATQGGEPLFDTKLVAKAREPIALFAIIIGAPLLLLSALTAQLYATPLRNVRILVWSSARILVRRN